MVSRRRTDPESKPTRRRPATTPEVREHQMISMAVDLAQRRLEEGTASAQEIVHFLKLGSSREKLEQERIRGEILLQEAKAEAMAASGRLEELFQGAIDAMRRYTGQEDQSDADDYQD